MPTERPKQERIRSIASATPGWWAEYGEKDGTVYRAPVSAWVVLEDNDGYTWIDGVDPGGEGWEGRPASEVGNFKRFVYDPAPSSAEPRRTAS